MTLIYKLKSTNFRKLLKSKGLPVSIYEMGEDEWKAELSVQWLLDRFTGLICLCDFFISTTVLRYQYPDNDFVPLRGMGGNQEGYITHKRYLVLIIYVLVILCFEVFHIVAMLLLFNRFYKLRVRTYIYFFIKSKYYRFITFFLGVQILLKMYLYRHKLKLSKF